MSEVNRSSGTSILVAAVVGAAVGAGVALLFAPRTGKETREWLALKSREIKDRAATELERGKEAVRRAAKDMGRDAEEAAEAHDRRVYTEAAATTMRG